MYVFHKHRSIDYGSAQSGVGMIDSINSNIKYYMTGVVHILSTFKTIVPCLESNLKVNLTFFTQFSNVHKTVIYSSNFLHTETGTAKNKDKKMQIENGIILVGCK